MYSAPYGYHSPAGQPYNGQNPQLQPGPAPNQPQQMMYNSQQFPMGASGAYSGTPSSAPMMPGGVGPAGMMQSPGMQQHMAANGQMGYQAPFTSSPYGAGVPSTAPTQGQFPPNYMMTGQIGGGFPINSAGMNQQQIMQQRMHQSQQNPGGMGVATPQRQFSGSQGTPNPSTQNQQQVQFSTPQSAQGTPQSQAGLQAQQVQQAVGSVTTPQTPTFPSAGQGASVNGISTPLSPGSESREKERFTLLLEINQELLYDLIHLNNTRDELKKEHEATSSAGATTPEQQKGMVDEEKEFYDDYVKVLRRLQANLAYLASVADKKPDTVVMPCPAYLSAPPMNLKLKFKAMTPFSDATEKIDPNTDREERDNYLKDMYKKLQALFPDFDPTKEPVHSVPVQQRPQGMQGPGGPAQAVSAQRSTGGQTPTNQATSSASPGSTHQKTPQMSTVPGPPTTQSATS